MDENKDMPNEETQATPEQPTEAGEEPVAAEEVAQEPLQEGPAEVEAPVADEMETPTREAASEEPGDQSPEEPEPVSDETETPAAVEEQAPEDQAAPEAETAQDENKEQAVEAEPGTETAEALGEILDAGQPPETQQNPTEGEQPAQTAEAAASPSSDLCPPSSDDSPTMESVIEAVLFATDEPLPESKLAGIVETTGKQIRESVENLNAKYQANGNAFRIEQIAGGYQMLTQPIYNSWLKKMLKVRSDNKLSPAAMETLAIIAYKQPIIRADIEAIRGVAVGEVIRSLMYKGLVKIAGRAEILGRPMLYGTTKKFLEVFGLNSVKDLPKAEDLKNPDRG
jgi:segregation and condensation protein B